ncbi:MAG TPA: dTDP-4-dehydrorhamnose reductase [Candidatus Manganitrophaceae bacterium]|nr:dTDP-4-dehydrorhamnose reductase [Candidatus Manganitrophaceae bacterium]
MKVLVTGAGGMLARAILNQIPEGWEVWAAGKEELDITDPRKVQEAILKFNPALIINCAAFTRVDECEAKRDLAFAVNGTAVGALAEAAGKAGADFVHFSTDYIFDGTKNRPYDEEDPPHPINVYGASKWEGERLLRKHLKKYLLIRAQWLYGQGGNHFVKSILRLAEKQETLRVVDDQVGAPTWTEDLAEATVALIQKGASGTYHLADAGQCSWYAFARRIIEEAGLPTQVVPCKSAEFPRPARRPAYSVLSTAKAAKELGRPMPPWETALKRFIRSM